MKRIMIVARSSHQHRSGRSLAPLQASVDLLAPTSLEGEHTAHQRLPRKRTNDSIHLHRRNIERKSLLKTTHRAVCNWSEDTVDLGPIAGIVRQVIPAPRPGDRDGGQRIRPERLSSVAPAAPAGAIQVRSSMTPLAGSPEFVW
jgi:hypothetical protein